MHCKHLSDKIFLSVMIQSTTKHTKIYVMNYTHRPIQGTTYSHVCLLVHISSLSGTSFFCNQLRKIFFSSLSIKCVNLFPFCGLYQHKCPFTSKTKTKKKNKIESDDTSKRYKKTNRYGVPPWPLWSVYVRLSAFAHSHVHINNYYLIH